jgi:hypothetical protein
MHPNLPLRPPLLNDIPVSNTASPESSPTTRAVCKSRPATAQSSGIVHFSVRRCLLSRMHMASDFLALVRTYG